MQVIHRVDELRARLAGETSVSLVPTMGNLHAGHIALAELAREVTEAVAMPTIGIGAGADCNGQVLVLHDMLGIYGAQRADYKAPRFVRNFMQDASSIQHAIANYVQAVKRGEFPAAEHSF